MPIFHFIRDLRQLAVTCLRLACAGLVLSFAVACSKNETRYDKAIELAKAYSLEPLPKDLAATFRGYGPKGDGTFFDVIIHKSFRGRFEEVGAKVLKEKFAQDYNPYLLNGILSGHRCAHEPSSLFSNVKCLDDDFEYTAGPIKLLRTKSGDFVYTTADIFRGNGSSTNENASQLVLILDPTDGSLGIIIEDKLAVSGSRPELMAAVLTLASSVTRVQEITPKDQKIQLNDLRYDLEAAKAGTLYSKPVSQPGQAVEADPVPNAAFPPTAAPTPETSQAPASITKDQLKELLFGKTPEEVFHLLGSPSNVSDTSDGLTWYYWSNALTVTDPIAGTTVNSSSVRFGRPPYVVREVSF